MSDTSSWPPSPSHDFATTRWSLVVHAAQGEDAAARASLAELCQRYWYPLYAFARRQSRDRHEAQDLTQEFFARLLAKGMLQAASPERGRFRNFLLASLKNFLANEWDRANAQKRGGGKSPVSLDLEWGESRWNLEPAHDLSPERLFERQWTLSLLDQVLTRLRDEFQTAGKSRQFELLKETLTGERADFSYEQLADELALSPAAVRQAAHRLRKRYRELLRDVVAETVAEPSEIDDEIRRLLASLAE